MRLCSHVYWEFGCLEVCESAALKNFFVFNGVFILIFLNLASGICPKYSKTSKVLNSDWNKLKRKLKVKSKSRNKKSEWVKTKPNYKILLLTKFGPVHSWIQADIRARQYFLQTDSKDKSRYEIILSFCFFIIMIGENFVIQGVQNY